MISATADDVEDVFKLTSSKVKVHSTFLGIDAAVEKLVNPQREVALTSHRQTKGSCGIGGITRALSFSSFPMYGISFGDEDVTNICCLATLSGSLSSNILKCYCDIFMKEVCGAL